MKCTRARAHTHTHIHTCTHTHDNTYTGLEDAQKVLQRETSESVWLLFPSSAETVTLQEAGGHKHVHGKHRITSFLLRVNL